jgi:hypothetical protein
MMNGDPNTATPLLVTTTVVAAALAAAVLWRKSKRDDSLIVENKGAINTTHKLLDYEKGLYLQDGRPITTLTWFRGDYRKAASILKERGALILEKNPWLGGRVLKIDGKLSLSYNNNNSNNYNFVQDHFCLIEPDESPLSRDIPIGSLGKAFKSLFLTNGPSKPLFRVTIVPCQNDSSDTFAVVVAVSHVVADGYTFYRIHNMLCSSTDEVIVSLLPERIETTVEQQRVALGKPEAGYGVSIGLMISMLRGLFVTMTVGPAAEGQFRMVDATKMSEVKKEAAKASGIPFVSANDVVTSWFLQNCKCEYGFMILNLRNRIAGHTERHAGNYGNGIFYRRSDSASSGLVRQSLSTLKRTITNDMPMPSFWQSATGSVGMVTNWATFAKPNIIDGCQEDLHVPLYDVVDSIPVSMAILVVFRSGPRGLALYTVGSPDKLECLSTASFFSSDPLL